MVENAPQTLINPQKDGTTIVTVLRDDLVRAFRTAKGRLEDRLVAVSVSEFGLSQADANDYAASVVHGHQDIHVADTKASDDLKALQVKHDALDKKFTDTTSENLSLKSQVSQLQSEAKDLNDKLMEARAEIVKLSAQVPAPDFQNNPPATGAVMPKPEGGTPPAEAEAAHVNTGVAASTATTGGRQGNVVG